MASENQLQALRNWLNRDIPEGEAICEMPAEVCSAALTKLHEASEAYKNGNKNGGIKKAKKEIIAELREQGWIGVPADVPAVAQQKAENKPLPKLSDELINEMFGDRAQAEIQRIREEQGLAAEAEGNFPKPGVADEIAKYVEILAQVTEAVNAEDRIPDREKGYATKFIYDSVTAEMQTGGDHE